MTATETGPQATRPGAAPTGRSPVVYIAGYGRSGSTLLERMLGTVPGWVNVGEINDMFRRMVRFDELCGCGERFSACPFWQAVGQRAFGGWSPSLVDEAVALQHQVARQRHLPSMAVPGVAARAYRSALARYGEIHARMYAAVLAESGGQVVVDASKGAAQALAVSRDERIDLRIVHLIRDARGVSFSWAKQNVQRPHGEGPRATMHRFAPAETALRWSLLQAEIGATKRLVPASTLVRYEDLVSRPEETLTRIVTELGFPVPEGGLSSIDGTTVDLPVTHGLSGNPSRFRAGPQALRADEQWRRDMPRPQRALTTVLASAALLRYGYLSTSRRGGRGAE